MKARRCWWCSNANNDEEETIEVCEALRNYASRIAINIHTKKITAQMSNVAGIA